jgi:hypothetical protein
MKLQYFTWQFFPIFRFEGTTPESPAKGGLKKLLPPTWQQLWGGEPPHTSLLGNGVQAQLKQTFESGR